MVKERSDDLDKKVLNLLPADGSEVRAKEVYAKAEANRIPKITVERKLAALEKERFIRRRQKSQKEVYYSRREVARIEHFINDFLQEIDGTLSKLPVEMRDFEKQLIEGSRTKAAGRDAAKILRSEPIYLRSLIMNALLRKVFEMYKATLHPQVRDKDFYLGYFDQSLHHAWRSEVEGKTRTKHSVKS